MNLSCVQSHSFLITAYTTIRDSERESSTVGGELKKNVMNVSYTSPHPHWLLIHLVGDNNNCCSLYQMILAGLCMVLFPTCDIAVFIFEYIPGRLPPLSLCIKHCICNE